MEKCTERSLQDLWSVGPAIRRDLAMLGINTVAELARRKPESMYRELCRKTRQRQDVCVLDVFHAAVAQARDPSLPTDQCVWWYWSRVRKAKSRAANTGVRRNERSAEATS
jgi:predicted RecB family nuclease